MLTYALSVRNFVEDIGAYAGFAAVVALALFALLLFAQARELKRLRDWGGQAHDRIGELERSVAAALDLARRAQSQQRSQAQGTVAPAGREAVRGPVARGRAAAGAAAAPAAGGPPRQAGAGQRAAVASTSAPVRPQLLPSAPVGVGGPALASATVLIPLPGAPGSPGGPPAPVQPQHSGPGGPGPRPVTQPAVAASVAGQRGRAVPAAGAGAPASAGARVRDAGAAPPPSGSNGHHDDDISEEYEQLPPRRVPPPPPPRRGAGPSTRPRPGGRPQPAAPLRAGAAGGGASRAVPPSDPAPHGRRRLIAMIAGVVALVAVAAVAFVVLTGGDDERRPVRVQAPVGNGRAQGRSTRQQTRTTPAPPHDQTTVAVLNGTATGGLASTVMTELTGAGFREGTVTNASDPNRSVTVVSFRAGKEREAQEVARTLRLSADAVQEIDAGTEAIACANTTPCTVDVVVTVGADRQPTQ
ncbi:LytR C-terminal domain-containing protein [Conexibacter woesei]|uniref:LytR/CpsA/Psr regulator C-terminal domain-containing protein n=1 Tax=Conexibacter woesei (strain DSM 14684 / CCUG 47730 / CIP 108061 / JCM 11494 / NBRC 100937 / ID131577) TaxID=469383 RepID=D3F440_CONWI|nr:LytR C-terminal domain-containing protein [Conexibacter woesei]ADB48523.1 hypothetical protein Cwoe_0087 [Conexibacter woesei DSM 14684]